MPDAILSALWRASWQAGVICLLVLALRWTLRDRLPPAWRCRLWGLVFLRLAVPVAGPASPLSLFNVVPADPLPTWPAATVVVVERTPVADLADADAPVPAAAPTPPARPVWPAVLLAGWIAGATTLAAVMAVAHVRFARRVRRESVPTPADWDAAWADVSGPRRPPLVVTAAVSSPALFGLVRGRLLLPPDVADRLSPAQLRLVFRHEHAHVRRWDLAIGWATVLVRCVYWFHPLAWAAVAGRRVDAELACDDRVTAATADPAAYGRTLLAVVAGGGRVPALGMADARTDLRRRLARVANGRRPGWGSAALAAAITAAVGCAALTASDRPANVTRTYDRFWPPDYSGTPIEVTTGSPTTLQSTTRPLPPGESVRVAMIRQSITPAAWGHHGVDVHDDGKFVVVTAPPETQAQVERLIAEKMIQVSVETRVLELRPSQVRAAGLDVPAVGVVGPLADDGVSRLVRAVELDAKSTSLTSPRLTLFNGQRALIVVETQQAYVSSLTPITAPGAILFDPNVSNTVVTGLVNNARVSALADRSAVDLTSEVQVARLLSLDKVEVAATTRPSIHGTYQVPHHRVLKVSADGVRVPTGHAVWTHGRWVDHRGELSPSGRADVARLGRRPRPPRRPGGHSGRRPGRGRAVRRVEGHGAQGRDPVAGQGVPAATGGHPGGGCR